MMQIIELVIYSNNGERRQLKFKLGQVNIVTGKSESGKTAVGDIIDYCLGRKECTISAGIVRESVSWYGILLQFDDGRVFVARQNPDANMLTTGNCYIKTGMGIESPLKPDFESNISSSSVVKLLSKKIGIGENINIPQDGHTRNPLETTIRHALFYCFQNQDEIAAKSFLFHRQAQDFVTQAIKDSLPYFLGAINEQALELEAKLKRLKREYRVFARDLTEEKEFYSKKTLQGASLLTEAIEVGLAKEGDVEPTDFNAIYDYFNRLEPATLLEPGLDNGTDVVENHGNNLSVLQEQYQTLTDEIKQRKASIQEAKDYQGYTLGYDEEIQHQKKRLESIGLFAKLNVDTDVCPFCSAPLNSQLPTVTALKASIQALDESIGQMLKERPRIQQFIQKQEDEVEAIHNKRKIIFAAIQAIYDNEERLRNIQNINSRRALVLGRISLWLESVEREEDRATHEARLNALLNQIRELEDVLDREQIEERIQSALSNMQNDMTQWAKELQLEGQGNPYRIDLGKATVVMDKDHPIPLQQMGSGSNWVGVHLISMFALHKFFINHQRPVPSFLFLDQPSQVYFPSMEQIEKNRDLKAVKRIYSFIDQQVSALKGKLQVIIVDHAQLKDAVFENHIVESWWDDDNNLVPQDWKKE